MAISEFIDTAKRLNDNDFGWYGGYAEHYGATYMDAVNKFVSTISTERSGRNLEHRIGIRKSVIKAILQIGAKILYNRPITSLGRKYVYVSKPFFYCMPTEEEFFCAAKQYILSYLQMCSKGEGVNVFDHLLWPQQSDTISEFFPENFKVIVVYRDPRDVYLLNKYYWYKPPVSAPGAIPYFPTDVMKFCDEWKRMIYDCTGKKNVLLIFFEDLVYQYDKTVKNIEDFLDLEINNHTKKYTFFEPERSIENTQVFRLSNEWIEEIAPINSLLSSYLYHFPYNRIPEKTLWFDSDLQLINVRKKKKINRDNS